MWSLIIINILSRLYDNNGVASNGSRKVFNQKVSVLSQASLEEALTDVNIILCKSFPKNWLSRVESHPNINHGHKVLSPPPAEL